VEVASDTQTGLVGSYGGLRIGTGNNLEQGTFWSGLIDDVRILRLRSEPALNEVEGTGSTTEP